MFLTDICPNLHNQIEYTIASDICASSMEWKLLTALIDEQHLYRSRPLAHGSMQLCSSYLKGIQEMLKGLIRFAASAST